MPLVLDQFVQWLADSGLMTSSEIDAVVESLPPSDKPQSGEDLAKLLYRRGKLTKYQAEALYRGKTKGLVMGNYVVLDKIGQGGMGQVYRARHRRMEREVAIKVLPSVFAKSKEAVDRFQREVVAAAKLNHPNIVTAHDADESDGLHFLVMEYVEGGDLSAVVQQQGPLPLGRAMDYVVQAAKGLEYAHSAGVVHRDIKPSNLLLDSSGTVKILDMGLARFDEKARQEGAAAQASLTQTGQVMGTVDYMSPEQAMDAHRADHRSDIYSLGCTLFYLLAGRPVYVGDSLAERLLARSTKEIPSLCEHRKDAPPALDKIFQKMVAKEAGDRYQSTSEVIADLEGLHLVLLEKGAAALERVPEPVREEPPQEELHQASHPTHSAVNAAFAETLPLPSAKTPLPQKPRQPSRGMKRDRRQTIIVAGCTLSLLLIVAVLILRTPKGTVVIQIDEPNAVVVVDDGKMQFTTSEDGQPLEIRLDEGEHTLTISKEGLEPYTRQLLVKKGQTETIQIELATATIREEEALRPAPAVAPTGDAAALTIAQLDTHVKPRDSAKPGDVAENKEVAQAAPPAQPRSTKRAQRERVYQFTDEKTINKDWHINGTKWRIELGGIRIEHYGTTIVSKDQFEGDFTARMAFAQVGCHLKIGIFGKSFQCDDHANTALIVRQGNSLTFNDGTGAPKTEILKSSEVDVATPLAFSIGLLSTANRGVLIRNVAVQAANIERPRDSAQPAEVAENKEVAQATPPAQPRSAKRAQRERVYEFTDEKTINKDWYINGTKWEIEPGGIRIKYYGTTIVSKEQFEGDFTARMTFAQVGCSLKISIFGNSFRCDKHANTALIVRQGNSLRFHDGTGAPTTLILKSSEVDVATPLAFSIGMLSTANRGVLIRNVAIQAANPARPASQN